jgi:sarcosine oxidase subunit alpha
MKRTAPNGSWRLPEGGAIDRGRPLTFSFNGRALPGFEGDTLASALLANGIRVVGRSFKYHRPRGVYSAGEEEPCALVEIGEGDARIPTCRAPTVPLSDGLVARSQHCWPSVDLDLGRVIDFTRRLWPAGFYNKTFKWPSWHAWEGLIRRSAGLGRPPTGPDPDRYEQVNAHCDLLVCGGGPAGLSAALVAGRAGLRVILVDQDECFGGTLNWEQVELDGCEAADWVAAAVSELADLPRVILLPRTVAAGIYDHNVTTLVERGSGSAWRECLWTVRPRHILLATGAIEQGLIFPDNDRPGIMLAGSVRHYLNRYAVVPGRQAVIATNNDSAYQTAFDLARLGIPVAAIVDQRGTVDPQLQARLAGLGAEIFTGARISGTQGGKLLRQVCVQRNDGRELARLQCDLLAVSGGWAPRVHLLAHARGGLQFDERSQSFVPARLPSGMSVAGSANGTAGLGQTLAEAARVARDACKALGVTPPDYDPPQVGRGIVESDAVAPYEHQRAASRQWIDLAHDVTLDDAELAVREGYVSVEHFKRYTTTGMSVDQGKTGNLNAFVVLGALTGRPAGEVGTTTFRPPYAPVTLGAVAGRKLGEFYAPRRYLPAHRVHVELGARFEDYGWQRPDCYPRPGESTEAAIRREVLAVRGSVGVFDNSPIGKLEVRGPDATAFLERIYVNRVASLKTGRARYGLMLNENGVIIDDGVFTRLADDHYLVNTTSGGVARVGAMMEEWLQCEWRDLCVLIDDVTTRWANFTVAGPNAREVIATLGTDIDLAADALPHMAAARGTVAGLDARLVRVSFSGEASYEINVPARAGPGLLRRVLEVGSAFDIAPYGIESLMMLRLEKGYLHVGTDTDGSSTPDDVGWGQVARSRTTDYLGRRSLFRAANLDPERKQLVGLSPLEPDRAVRPGGHLLLGTGRRPPATTDGWITSAGFSPTLGRHIALGVLRAGRERLGETVTVCDEDQTYGMHVVSPLFYDPDNERLRS